MGIVPDIVSSGSTDGYAELKEEDLRTPPNTGTEIRFVDVRSQNDLVSAKEVLHNDNIVIADIAYIESNGLSLDVVTAELQEAVSAVNGDIVHKKRNDLVIATPRDASINREKL